MVAVFAARKHHQYCRFQKIHTNEHTVSQGRLCECDCFCTTAKILPSCSLSSQIGNEGVKLIQEKFSPGVGSCLFSEIQKLGEIPEFRVILGERRLPLKGQVPQVEIKIVSKEKELAVVKGPNEEIKLTNNPICLPGAVDVSVEQYMCQKEDSVEATILGLEEKDEETTRSSQEWEESKDIMKTNLDLGASGQPGGPSYQAKLAGQLKGHQSKVMVKKSSVNKKAKPKPKQKLKKAEVGVKKQPLEAKIKTGGEEGKFTRMRSVFEPRKVDVQVEECEALVQVDSLAGKGARVVARRIAKPGRVCNVGGKGGLVQASIQKFLNLSEDKMVTQGRLPKRKWGAVEENTSSSTEFKEKK